jgi:hypothetical protein
MNQLYETGREAIFISWNLVREIFLYRWIEHDLVKLLTWNSVVGFKIGFYIYLCMIFLYNFLFVVYFYYNKIWCIEKLVLQYTIKPIDFTGMSISQSTAHTSQH